MSGSRGPWEKYTVPDIIIRDIESIIVDLPLRRLQRFSALAAQRQSLVVIRIRSTDGIMGVGEASIPSGPWWGGESVETIKSIADIYLAPVLIGQRATDMAVLRARMDEAAFGNSFAKAGLEMALWDLIGHTLEQPVHALLGGKVRDSLNVAWPLATGDPRQEIDEALAKLEAGEASAFKLKMGAVELKQDVARACEVTLALRDRAGIRVDPNERWTEVDALWAIPRLAEVGVEMIEQPLPREDLDGPVRLQARAAMPIMLDESIRTPHDMLEAAKKGAGALISLKIMKSGGMVPSRAVADVALAAGAALYMGTFLESSLGTSGNMQFCATLPHLPLGGELVGPMLVADDITEEPVRYMDGALQLPKGNGIGARIDEDKLKSYRRDRAHTTVTASTGQGGGGTKLAVAGE
ncbi:muconate/chloromuconate family cycloisomerase [Sphingobium scionense]|uniref:muconate/chloromuconate family cycloisomerase n=1 Tax=Sphingobium scionense TaxID=1404341 RepID=UPI0009FAB599|nr:muconate/chloromuconate family cycloisomerase [Sphingobium scionense]